MATIKLQNGLVLLKGGLASCECCGLCNPNYTEYCVTVTPIGGSTGSVTVTGDLDSGYFSDGGSVELYWDEANGGWALTDGIGISQIGSGSTDRCDPTGSSYSDPSTWDDASVTLGPCP